jgi:glycosyltransferase involved in cell wall biosynthesis
MEVNGGCCPKDMKVPLSVIVLTCNEEKNIEGCLKDIYEWAGEIFVVDSGSTDKTIEIARKFTDKIYQNKFESYARQRNWALDNLPISHDWVFFLDADEYLTDELKKEIEEILPVTDYDGFYIKRRFYFMGRWIRHGGYYPTWILRLFRKEKAVVVRDINEYVDVRGKVGYLKNDFVDDNKKGIDEWIAKHSRYATFEAMELIEAEDKGGRIKDKGERIKEKGGDVRMFGNQAQRKRWIRQHIWNPLMPPLIRPFIYFIYRYFFRFGFLDGKEGFIYHFLQGLWFPFLIDVKYLEMKKGNIGDG